MFFIISIFMAKNPQIEGDTVFKSFKAVYIWNASEARVGYVLSKETSAVCCSSPKGNWIMYQLCDRIILSSFKVFFLPKICIHLLYWHEACGIYNMTQSLGSPSTFCYWSSAAASVELHWESETTIFKLLQAQMFRFLLFLDLDSLVLACVFFKP